jgi:hypothetical protein
LRPGRIDMMVQFEILSQEQLHGLLKSYNITLSKTIFSDLFTICQKDNLVPATLSEFMFRYIKDNDDGSDAEDEKDAKDTIDAKDAKDAKNAKDAKDAKDSKDANDVKNYIEHNELNDSNFINLFKKYLQEINIVIEKNKHNEMIA